MKNTKKQKRIKKQNFVKIIATDDGYGNLRKDYKTENGTFLFTDDTARGGFALDAYFYGANLNDKNEYETHLESEADLIQFINEKTEQLAQWKKEFEKREDTKTNRRNYNIAAAKKQHGDDWEDYV